MNVEQSWFSERVGEWVTLVRWGDRGVPVLVFPTAGGDAWEIERRGLVGSLWPLIEAGRIKVYSVDSISGRSWLRSDDPRHSMWLQNRFDECIRWEVVPAIRADCGSDTIEIVGAGASIGAFWAVEVICRHPDVFRLAIGMSGTYDLSGWLFGHWSDDFYFSSPIDFVPGLDGEALDRLRSRYVVLASGSGDWEDPEESWRMAAALGSKGVPNRVDIWSSDHPHDWPTWQQMLPLYLDDLV
ncbi:MAG: alpha/beta hydrolase-fold protein [Acidimicrobiia bacterium]|nr:alpha/beta hydrolase-fold protein [Acidimicrobiia bacterium]